MHFSSPSRLAPSQKSFSGCFSSIWCSARGGGGGGDGGESGGGGAGRYELVAAALGWVFDIYSRNVLSIRGLGGSKAARVVFREMAREL